jgi:hypothetical protein
LTILGGCVDEVFSHFILYFCHVYNVKEWIMVKTKSQVSMEKFLLGKVLTEQNDLVRIDELDWITVRWSLALQTRVFTEAHYRK